MTARPIVELRNLGPKCAEWLADVGIETEDQLRAIGVLPAFLRLRAGGRRVSLNALYAMDAALAGIHWMELPPERKQELRAAAAFAADEL